MHQIDETISKPKPPSATASSARNHRRTRAPRALQSRHRTRRGSTNLVCTSFNAGSPCSDENVHARAADCRNPRLLRWVSPLPSLAVWSRSREPDRFPSRTGTEQLGVSDLIYIWRPTAPIRPKRYGRITVRHASRPGSAPCQTVKMISNLKYKSQISAATCKINIKSNTWPKIANKVSLKSLKCVESTYVEKLQWFCTKF
jgi:hypothetical protein